MAADDSWESGNWEETDEPDREEVLRLARQLADQRARQRAEDLAELEELKRALRERAAEVAAREAEVTRMQAVLAARDEELRRREREVADAERLRERAAAVPLEPYLSFSEGLDALAARSFRDLRE